ncbi:MAG: hypothetical protein HN352_14565 [Bacteroidetes bacterium]|jgi:outer membrane lipoprotein-sorting protein|nr:hypothetical protein [Bacteroidota bacterium]MBT3747709.1 hypothetical protein [Bacteroidota bacterium]MBT4401895.1 hypothetical protein [Bacteroidota bacterium]MBT4408425.1 hypothetical protein [Bacteroidota bacterium]MBT5426268.1 hypothetical protein [Bacteroidota bacterium]
MKKITLSLAFALLVSSTFLNAQNLEEVLDNYFEVLGQETILEAKNSQTNGKMLQSGLEIPFKQYAASPNKFRSEGTFQGMTFIQSFNGENGWSFNPFAGMTEAQELNEDELKVMKVQADYEGVLWNWKDKGHSVTLEGTEEVEGAECHVVKSVLAGGDIYTSYIDVENFVMIKQSAKITMQGQEIESDTFMSNFQEGDGFIYPGKIENRVNGQVMSTIVIEEMILGAELDASLFEKPVI